MKSSSKALAEPKNLIHKYPDSALLIDKATKNKIQRHLTDINDHITEDDIRNIDTNITANFLQSIDQSVSLIKRRTSGSF